MPSLERSSMPTEWQIDRKKRTSPGDQLPHGVSRPVR